MAYIGKAPASGIRNRFIYTATAGQTTFSGADDESRTLSYTDGHFTDVYLNGVKLDKSDYTATSGTSVVLDEGAAVDDILEVLAFDTFSVFSGEFSQDVTVGGTLTASGNVDITGTVTAGAGAHTIGDGTGASQVIIKASASTNSTIDFGDPDDTNIGRIQYNNTDNYMLFRTNNTERMRIDSSGRLLVGKASASRTTVGHELRASGFARHTAASDKSLEIVRTGTNGEVVEFFKDTTLVGYISVTGSSTSYNTSSDYRLKENAVDISDGITRVKQLQPKRFNFIADDSTTVDGFMAHEAQTVVPEAVTGTHNEVDDDGNPVYQAIDQAKLVPLLTAALQEAIAKIETLETENADFETRIAALEAN